MSSPINVSYVTPGAIIAVGAIFPVLSILHVGLRFYVRRVQKAKLLADDWLLIPALVLIIGMGVALIVGAKGKGLGYTKGLPPGAPPEAEFTYMSPQIILTEKVEWSFQLMQIVSLGFIKLSFIMFYRRIFCTGKRTWFSISTVVMGSLIIAWTATFFFVFLFYCGSHPSKEWGTVVDIITYCPNALSDQLALGISDSIMDVFIITMPIPVIFSLHLGTAKKVMVMGIFLLGGFAVAASIVRMGIFIKVVLVGFSPNLDGDKDVSLILFWSMIESGAAIIAACLPTLRYLFGQSMVDKLLRSIRSTFSLHSQASRSWPSRPTKFENRTSQGSSVEHIAGIETVSSVESYAMRDLGCSEVMRPPNGAIDIQHTFRQQESYV